MKKRQKAKRESEPAELAQAESRPPETVQEEAAAAAPAAPPEAPPEPPKEAEAKEDPLKKLEAECSALRDQLIRRQADFENFRKRADRDVNEFKQLAAAELTEALLPILDGFERALEAQGGDSIEDYKKGFELIYKQFYDTLMRFGLMPVKAAGRPFDPHYHYAVERVETDAHKDQTVLEELQRGYTFKHKLLRAAMVRVAVHPTPPPAAAEAPPAESAESAESAQNTGSEGSKENKPEG